jgi:hypothetical protein
MASKHPLLATNSITPFVPLLLPHLDALDSHLTHSLLRIGATRLPSLTPLIAIIPEGHPSVRCAVDPRFTILAILKPVVRTTDSNVENEVERLIKGRRRVAGAAPRVDIGGAVGHA